MTSTCTACCATPSPMAAARCLRRRGTRSATDLGIYEPGCGLDNLVISFGHDEYLYRVLRDAVADGGCSLPEEALHPIRYRSRHLRTRLRPGQPGDLVRP